MHWGYPRSTKVRLFCADSALALLARAASLAWLGRYPIHLARMAALSIAFALILLSFYYIFDIYDLTRNGEIAFRYRVAAVYCASLLVTSALSLASPALFCGRECALAAVTAAISGAMVLRAIYRVRPGAFVERRSVLIVGSAEDTEILAGLLPEGDMRFEFVGYFGSPNENEMDCRISRRQDWEIRQDAWLAEVACQVLEIEDAPARYCAYLGNPEPEAIRRAVENHNIEILAVDSRFISPEFGTLLTELRFRGLRVYSLPDFCMQLSEELPLAILSDEWLSFSDGFDVLQSRVLRRVKRLSDLFLAAATVLVAAPLMMLTALMIKLESPGPALFRQTRVGWKGRPYRLLKFRSMRQNAETNGAQWAQVDDPRVTRVGKWIRRLRIDELPQLFNVMAGQMSFVGPRPERPEFVERLECDIPFYQLRHCLAPGITGWAQVKYPYGASVEDARRKLQYDLYYIRNASPIVDFRILLRTVRTILYLQGSR